MEKKPVFIDKDPETGLKMFRKFITQVGSRENETVQIVYEEWLETLSQKVYHPSVRTKNYFLRNEYNSEGQLLNYGYDKWAYFKITEAHIGLTLDDIIVGAVNRTLQSLPCGIPDGYMVVLKTKLAEELEAAAKKAAEEAANN